VSRSGSSSSLPSPACGGGGGGSTASTPVGTPILHGVATQLDNALVGAQLTERERRVVERLLSRLRSELGPGLLAVWLYGSRARGEADVEETDPDRRSDVDLMVVVDPSRDANELSWALIPLVNEAADAEGDSPVYYSVLVWSIDRLRDRRDIRSFFVQEVDRDKIVLHGSALEAE
jgi:predicted nucleotidyltransferase